MAKQCPTCDIEYDDAQAFCPKCGTALRDGARGDLVGSVIGERYLITGLLGEGGMGRVYRARHVRLPKDVAIKVLDGSVARDPAALRRFADEATRQSRVRNPHVVAVEDFGETADREPYLVMELVEGPTLRELLNHGALSPARVVRCITQLADGLEAIHALPIVHRDLKPENVMIATAPDGSELVKLLDFGIGKALDDSDSGRTQTGLVIGTPAYMSPEQVGGEPLDARSDVYALALMAYEMLAGRQAFGGKSPHELMYSRLSSDPVPMTVERQRSGREPLAAAVDDVLARGLARDRDLRTPTAAAFAEALAAAVGSPRSMGALAERAGRSVESLTPIIPQPAVPETPRTDAGGRSMRVQVLVAATVAVAAVGTWIVRGRDRSADAPASTTGTAGTPAAPITAPAPAATDSAATAPTPTLPPTATPAPGTAEHVRGSSPADLAELEAIGKLTEDGDDAVSPDILARTAALLPRLRSADDSAEALLYRGNAFFMQNNLIEACRAFSRARPSSARSGTVSALNLGRNSAGCP